MASLRDIIRPEIQGDDFYNSLRLLAQTAAIKTILEIGASSGAGSTDALARGIAKNPAQPTLFTIECSRPRFAKLAARYKRRKDIKPYNVSSVGISDFPDEAKVRDFYHSYQTLLNTYPEETVIGWLKQDIAYIVDDQIPVDGIEQIKAANGIIGFDYVLIDGSEFTGQRELELVYGAKIVALDDIMSFKNFENHRRLLSDPAYEICMMNRFQRNGYSIFMRRP